MNIELFRHRMKSLRKNSTTTLPEKLNHMLGNEIEWENGGNDIMSLIWNYIENYNTILNHNRLVHDFHIKFVREEDCYDAPPMFVNGLYLDVHWQPTITIKTMLRQEDYFTIYDICLFCHDYDERCKCFDRDLR